MDTDALQINEWLTDGWLFEPVREPLWSYEEDHLARMTEALDTQFEASFLAKCKRRDEFFNQEGTYVGCLHDIAEHNTVPSGGFAHFTVHKEPTWRLRRTLEKYSELGEDIDAAERFLKRCVQLSPERRATAKELVDDPWLAI